MNPKRKMTVILVALLACTAGAPAVARLASNSVESNRLAANRLAANSAAPNAAIGDGAIDAVVRIELADGTRIEK